jgi:hypothetical protein
MGRASSSKKVARAARAAGKPGTGRNWLWPAAIIALVAVGISLVWVSRGTDEASAEAPTFGDHWHSAYGIYTCDDFVAPLADQNGDANGIHTHEDGLIHIHPTSSQATGDNATISVFAEETGLVLEDDRLEVPGGDTFVEGEDECGGEPGIVQVAVWDDPADETPEVVTEDMADIKLGENQVLTIAFAPEGADLPTPPTAVRLSDPNAAEEGRPVQPIEGVPDPSTPSTPPAAPGDTSTSAPAAPGDSTTTTAPASDSTTTSAP